MTRLSGPALRHKRAESWMERARGAHGDLDARFIFSWIAFNALYGQARYRHPEGRIWSEMRDIREFLKLMVKLDPRGVSAIFKEHGLKEHVSNLLRDKFLHDCCWKAWNADKVFDRAGRESFVPDCNEKDDDELIQVFRRLYVLRKQMFHGCSKDGSSKNRPSLRVAVPVLQRFVEGFLELISRRSEATHVVSLLGEPPYPPTAEKERWNSPRVIGAR